MTRDNSPTPDQRVAPIHNPRSLALTPRALAVIRPRTQRDALTALGFSDTQLAALDTAGYGVMGNVNFEPFLPAITGA